MMDVFHVFPGTVAGCVEVLNRGDLLSIAPGGVREAQFGDNRYQLIWGNRIGFAKVGHFSFHIILQKFITLGCD